jgi:ribonuclease HII
MIMSDILPFYKNDQSVMEIGVDEAGRGPLFGRVYTAAVILPKEGFDYSRMKDSKRFHSEKKNTRRRIIYKRKRNCLECFL